MWDEVVVMIWRYGRLGVETGIVIAVLIGLKVWFFPLIIALWFPGSPLAERLTEWTVIMVGIITLFIYLGLGSTSKYVYRFSTIQAALGFAVWHFPILSAELPLFHTYYMCWKNLLGDFLSLFFPSHFFSSYEVLIIYLTLYLLGRKIRVTELAEEKEREKKERFNLSSF
jgi:hypothetical protein